MAGIFPAIFFVRRSGCSHAWLAQRRQGKGRRQDKKKGRLAPAFPSTIQWIEDQ